MIPVKTLRNLVLGIYKELYLWIGDQVKLLIKNMKEND